MTWLPWQLFLGNRFAGYMYGIKKKKKFEKNVVSTCFFFFLFPPLFFLNFILNVNVILINKYDFNAFSCSFVFSSKNLTVFECLLFYYIL